MRLAQRFHFIFMLPLFSLITFAPPLWAQMSGVAASDGVTGENKTHYSGQTFTDRGVKESSVTLGNQISSVEDSGSVEWSEIKGEHFIIRYERDESRSPQEILENAESYYDEISSLLGYSGLDSVWLWGARCVIYLYGSKESFLVRTGRPAWSSGFAVLREREIYSYEGAPDFLLGVLPHELTHLLFRDFLGTSNAKIPLWLEEGVAMTQEKKSPEPFENFMKDLAKNGDWIPMEVFFSVRTVQGLPDRQVAAFYAQAQSVVAFLLREFGKKRFVSLCRSLRDGVELRESLKRIYPVHFQTAQDLEKRWAASLQPE